MYMLVIYSIVIGTAVSYGKETPAESIEQRIEALPTPKLSEALPVPVPEVLPIPEALPVPVQEEPKSYVAEKSPKSSDLSTIVPPTITPEVQASLPTAVVPEDDYSDAASTESASYKDSKDNYSSSFMLTTSIAGISVLSYF